LADHRLGEACVNARVSTNPSLSASENGGSDPNAEEEIMTTRLFTLVFASFVWLAYASAHAELSAPQHATLHSAILKQERAIDVYLPKDHEKNAAQRFETLYVLDGDWNAKIVVETVDFLQSVGFVPPIIVVSVPNYFDGKGVNSRDHDLTPTALPNEPRSGGAADFLAFLKTELLPYVNSHYPANGVSLVHGHSYGGLFLTYVLANDPTVFDGYLILDPAMWWDQHLISKSLDEKIAATPTQGKAIYIAGRSGPAFKGMGVDSLQPVFETKAPKALPWKIVAYPNETHDSLKFKATFDALKFVYRGFHERPIDVDPTTGIVARGQPLVLQADTDRFDIYYTTDGSEPTVLSSKMEKTVSISDPAKIRLKAISTRGHYDQDIVVHLKFGDVLTPAHATKTNGKIEYRIAYYAPDAWRNFRKRPFESATVADVDFDHVGRDSFAGAIERDVNIPADSYYTFVLGSSDKARLFIDGKKLIDIDSTNEQKHRAFVVPMRAGIYTVRVEFLRASKNSRLDFHLHQYKDDGSGWENELH
jgi:predicted alpha/beta superfamily hydrolase